MKKDELVLSIENFIVDEGMSKSEIKISLELLGLGERKISIILSEESIFMSLFNKLTKPQLQELHAIVVDYKWEESQEIEVIENEESISIEEKEMIEKANELINENDYIYSEIAYINSMMKFRISQICILKRWNINKFSEIVIKQLDKKIAKMLE